MSQQVSQEAPATPLKSMLEGRFWSNLIGFTPNKGANNTNKHLESL